MARPFFSARRDGTIAVRLGGSLRPVIAGQLRELDALMATVEASGAGPVDPLAELTGMVDVADRAAPEDPALRRLRPDAYAADVDDGRAAAEYRRLAGGELAAVQRSRIATVLETLARGDRFALDTEEAQAWLGTLNDLRLALGSRLGIVDDEASTLEQSPGLQLYAALGALQHQLLVALGAPDEF